MELKENATRRHLLAEALLQLPKGGARVEVAGSGRRARRASLTTGRGERHRCADASERAKDDMRAVYRILPRLRRRRTAVR
ncbi:MAG: hypothetical protein ACLSVD_10020 [Eggerthellaceae bacterium]